MKNTGKCPKCHCDELLRVPGSVRPDGAGNNMAVGFFSAVLVTRFVCCECGYSEEWIESATDLRKLKAKFEHADQ